MIHICQQKAQRILNPIIDWEDEEVWEFIKEYKIPYCKLYDEGFKRIGCIGCPMAGQSRIEEFKRYPKYKQNYIKAFQRMIDNHSGGGTENSRGSVEMVEYGVRQDKKCSTSGLYTEWKTGNGVMEWLLER